jgi:5-methylcytosine-specific restriction endonuclease McrA
LARLAGGSAIRDSLHRTLLLDWKSWSPKMESKNRRYRAMREAEASGMFRAASGKARTKSKPRLSSEHQAGEVVVKNAAGEVIRIESSSSHKANRMTGVDKKRYADKKQRARILARDGYLCRYCKRPVSMETANIDHVIPWKHGGRTTDANLVSCCRFCNYQKGNSRWKPTPHQ